MQRILNNLDKCYGCFACENVCPTQCIEMKENEEGFLIPFFNSEKCIHCNLCEKSCQMFNDFSDKKIFDKNYIVRARNEKILKQSASGGAFGMTAYYFLSNGGIVYGAGTANNRVQILRIDKEDDLWKIQNSKYVQCDINNTYIKIQQDLKEGKRILFGGTPCQIAGLKLYIKKEENNLYCMDLICHGVPSQKLLKYNLSSLGINHFDDIRFRYKKNPKYSRSAFVMQVTESGKKKTFLKDEIYYYQLFSEGKIFRNSCYKCKYANLNRVGDMTIGDVDSYMNYSFYPDNSNSSLIINTQKGLDLWNEVKEHYSFTRLNINEEAKVNTQLTEPSKYYPIRNNIYQNMAKFSDDSKTKYNSCQEKIFKIKKWIKLNVPDSFIKKLITRKRVD